MIEVIMHSFSDLIQRATLFSLSYTKRIRENIIEELDKSGATLHVKNLQMLELQQAIFAVGMFSIFDAHLQYSLNCKNGFQEIQKILIYNNKNDLFSKFHIFYLAINVLKHGRGKSYDQLLLKDNLPFRLKRNDEYSFEEGDVSEIMTWIRVDENFLKDCATVIQEVSNILYKTIPNYYD